MSHLGRVKFREWDCGIELNRYGCNHREAIELFDHDDGRPVARATVNIPEAHLEPGEVIIKDYSENAGIQAVLVEAGIIEPTGRMVPTGMVTCEVCRLLKIGE